MRVAMVVGSYPPAICGVGDYTYCLVKYLKKYRCNVEVITSYKWNIKEKQAIESKLKGFDIVHIQYPSVGYGYSLLPQILSRLPNTILTLHEISQAKILRRISLIPFFFCVKNIIFTNEFEKNYVDKLNGFFCINTFKIPIGSNISYANTKNKDRNKIVHFGLIRKNKGLEEVVKLAEEIKKRKLPYAVQIVGQVERKQINYFKEIKDKTTCIDWKIGCSEREVAKLLSEAMFAYLPFPDGASERRGSLIASLLNKVVVITKRGKFTTPEMEKSMLFSSSVNEAIEHIDYIEKNPFFRESIIRNASEYVEKFSWNNIANAHLEVYKNTLRNI